MVRTSKQQLAKKYFLIEEAELILPKVEKIIRKVVKLNRALDLLSTIEIEVFDDDFENIGKITKANKHFHKLSYDFYHGIEKLEDMGCVVKDYEFGIINFYHQLGSRDIFLCWTLGEKQISYWHEIEEESSEKKPIINLISRK
jgi:hypothetical protein